MTEKLELTVRTWFRWSALGVCSLLCGVVFTAGCGSSAPAPPGSQKAEKAEKPKKPRKEFRKVLPTIAFEMLRDNEDLVVLDLREPEEFSGELGHIAGAINLPASEIEEKMLEIESLKGRTFLVYCRAKDDERGPTITRLLRREGWRDAILIEGGLEAWIRFGFTTAAREARPPRADG